MLFWLFGLPFGMFFTGNIVACELYKGIVYWDTTKSPNDLQIFIVYLLVGTISFIAGLVIKKKYQLPFNWKK